MHEVWSSGMSYLSLKKRNLVEKTLGNIVWNGSCMKLERIVSVLVKNCFIEQGEPLKRMQKEIMRLHGGCNR